MVQSCLLLNSIQMESKAQSLLCLVSFCQHACGLRSLPCEYKQFVLYCYDPTIFIEGANFQKRVCLPFILLCFLGEKHLLLLLAVCFRSWHG